MLVANERVSFDVSDIGAVREVKCLLDKRYFIFFQLKLCAIAKKANTPVAPPWNERLNILA